MSAQCTLCPHHCTIPENGLGACRARSCRDGKVVCSNFGCLTSLALDPVEKKPFRRFHPGCFLLSAGSYGCNLSCPFCQNHVISMAGPEAEAVFVSPALLIEKANALRAKDSRVVGIAFTYNEPLIGFEYLLECGRLAKKEGLLVALVTNGMIDPEPLSELLPYSDAMNIDLKTFSRDGYKRLGGDLDTVMKTIQAASKRCHVEVTTLAVPGFSDGEAAMEKESAWLASVDPEIPLHISRFFPRYRMSDLDPTPVGTVYRLCAIAGRVLRYVYPGNC